MKITTLEMEIQLAYYFDFRRNLIVPNVSWGVGLHECDLLIVRKSGYALEIEIKVTRADLKADFNKKHTHFDRRIKELYFAIPQYLYESCKDLIPPHAGIITVTKGEQQKGFFRRSETKHHMYSVTIKRNALPNSKSTKFNDTEILKIAKLGAMRIFPLKQKI